MTWVEENQKWALQYPDFVLLVGQQIHKDFSLEGLEIVHDQTDDLHTMYQRVYAQVTHFVQSDFNALMRLLYRIDISEGKVQRQMDLIPDDTARAISELILKREMQKVVLRKQFSA